MTDAHKATADMIEVLNKLTDAKVLLSQALSMGRMDRVADMAVLISKLLQVTDKLAEQLYHAAEGQEVTA